MRSSNIEILKCYLCTLDYELPFPNFNEAKISEEDELYKYITQLLAYNYDNVSSKRATFDESSYLAEILPPSEKELEGFVDVVSEKIHTMIKSGAELRSGSGIFVWTVILEQPIVAFFKMNFQNKFMCFLSDTGAVSWHMNSKVLPASSQKDYEYFIINILDKTVRLSDSVCYVGSECVNYLANKVLKLDARRSEKEHIKRFDDAVVETIKECYEEKEAPKKIMEYKAEIAQTVDSAGSINVSDIEKTVFADNEKAAQIYENKMQEEEIPWEPMTVSPKMERVIKKKQKIVTDNGIEIMVPVEYLTDESVFECRNCDDGSVAIIIRGARSIQNK